MRPYFRLILDTLFFIISLNICSGIRFENLYDQMLVLKLKF